METSDVNLKFIEKSGAERIFMGRWTTTRSQHESPLSIDTKTSGSRKRRLRATNMHYDDEEEEEDYEDLAADEEEPIDNASLSTSPTSSSISVSSSNSISPSSSTRFKAPLFVDATENNFNQQPSNKVSHKLLFFSA